MRRAGNIDANQPEIVKSLRKAGCSVWITSGFGHGAPDLVVGARGRTYLFEIKDPAKPPSKRKMTTDEKAFHFAWQGHIAVIETAEDALKEIFSSPRI